MSMSHTTAPAVAKRWRLDADESTAEFRVPHFWGLVQVHGHFDRLGGWLAIGPSGEHRLEQTLDPASVTTGNRKRDKHLRSSDFFDTQRHPEIRFRATAVRDAGDGRLHVEGELEAAGNRVALVLEPKITQAGERLLIHACATVDQRRLGM